jgi:hypothetical protein
MPNDTEPVPTHLARIVLVTFLLTFITARTIVFLIMSRSIPDLYLRLGGTHVHHLNYGIFLLAALAGYLLLYRPAGKILELAALIYGIGTALTFDEFGMWIHLGGSYWQRASWDAIVVVSAIFALLAFAPSLKKFRPHHWLTTVTLLLAAVIFFILLARSFEYAGKKLAPRIHEIESTAPH